MTTGGLGGGYTLHPTAITPSSTPKSRPSLHGRRFWRFIYGAGCTRGGAKGWTHTHPRTHVHVSYMYTQYTYLYIIYNFAVQRGKTSFVIFIFTHIDTHTLTHTNVVFVGIIYDILIHIYVFFYFMLPYIILLYVYNIYLCTYLRYIYFEMYIQMCEHPPLPVEWPWCVRVFGRHKSPLPTNSRVRKRKKIKNENRIPIFVRANRSSVTIILNIVNINIYEYSIYIRFEFLCIVIFHSGRCFSSTDA